jgi:hypothetical protein
MHGIDDESQIRLPVPTEWCGNTDDYGVDFRYAGEVMRSFKTVRAHGLNFRRRNMLYRRLAIVERFNPRQIDIKTKDAQTDFLKAECQWNSHIAEADDSDTRLTLLHAFHKNCQIPVFCYHD